MTAGALSLLLGEFQIHTRDAPKALHLFVICPIALQCSAASGPGNPESRLNIIGKNVQNHIKIDVNLNKYGIFVHFFGGTPVSGSGVGQAKVCYSSCEFVPNPGAFEAEIPPNCVHVKNGGENALDSPEMAIHEAMGRVLLRPTPLPGKLELSCATLFTWGASMVHWARAAGLFSPPEGDIGEG